jgi:hypothetical protein
VCLSLKVSPLNKDKLKLLQTKISTIRRSNETKLIFDIWGSDSGVDVNVGVTIQKTNSDKINISWIAFHEVDSKLQPFWSYKNFRNNENNDNNYRSDDDDDVETTENKLLEEWALAESTIQKRL